MWRAKEKATLVVVLVAVFLGEKVSPH